MTRQRAAHRRKTFNHGVSLVFVAGVIGVAQARLKRDALKKLPELLELEFFEVFDKQAEGFLIG